MKSTYRKQFYLVIFRPKEITVSLYLVDVLEKDPVTVPRVAPKNGYNFCIVGRVGRMLL